jgi:excisionase family DNA binding protein
VREKAFISVQDYAKYRGVHRNTIMKWIRAGRVPAEQPAGKNGKWAIPREMIIENPTYPPLADWPERPI